MFRRGRRLGLAVAGRRVAALGLPDQKTILLNLT
jgi:hypothetical protein